MKFPVSSTKKYIYSGLRFPSFCPLHVRGLTASKERIIHFFQTFPSDACCKVSWFQLWLTPTTFHMCRFGGDGSGFQEMRHRLRCVHRVLLLPLRVVISNPVSSCRFRRREMCGTAVKWSWYSSVPNCSSCLNLYVNFDYFLLKS
jgi:hypothetical protein